MMEEQRIHHYSKGAHWAHDGQCQPWCETAYAGLVKGPCSGRFCAAWKKEAPK